MMRQMPDTARLSLEIVSILLRQGQLLDRLSRAITVAALVGLVVCGVLLDRPPVFGMVLMGAVIVMGVIELWFAVRVAIDADLFHCLADDPDWAALDAALVELDMIPASKTGRAAKPRIAGARRLLRFQSLALIVQLVLAVTGAVFGAIR